MTTLIGVLISLTTLIPGWGTGLALTLTTLYPNTGLPILCSSLILNTIPEGLNSETSGNSYGVIFNERLKLNQIKTLITWKAICWISGLGIGLYYPPFLGNGNVTLSFIILVAILSKYKNNIKILAISYVLSVATLLKILNFIHVPNPIIVVSLLLFVIPNGLKVKKIKRKVNLEEEIYQQNVEPNILVILWSTLWGLFAPGVSPQAISSQFNKELNSTTRYISLLCLEPLIEGIGLAQAYKGETLGKTLVSSYVILPDFKVLITSVGIIIFMSLLAYWLIDNVNFDYSNTELTASAVGIIGLIVMTHLWAMPLILLSLIIYYFLGDLPTEVKGLTFLAGII